MDNDILVSTDELKEQINRSLKPILELSVQIECIYQNKLKATIRNIKHILLKFKETIEKIVCDIYRMIQPCRLLELSIPNLSVPMSNFDYVPQGPPLIEESIKETAIENFYYNMNKFKNLKLIKLIKEKYPAFIETLIFEILIHIIFKALGMQ